LAQVLCVFFLTFSMRISDEQFCTLCVASSITTLQEGILLKRGGSQDWTPRKFRLRGNCLFYFDDADPETPAAVLLIEDCRVEALAAFPEGWEDTFPLRIVYHGERAREARSEVVLLAPTEEERTHWVESLNLASTYVLRAQLREYVEAYGAAKEETLAAQAANRALVKELDETKYLVSNLRAKLNDTLASSALLHRPEVGAVDDTLLQDLRCEVDATREAWDQLRSKVDPSLFEDLSVAISERVQGCLMDSRKKLACDPGLVAEPVNLEEARRKIRALSHEVLELRSEVLQMRKIGQWGDSAGAVIRSGGIAPLLLRVDTPDFDSEDERGFA